MIDREKVDVARTLIGVATISDVVEVALDRTIDDERLRRDVAAYRRSPTSEPEGALGELVVEFDLGDDDFDYDTLYGVDD